MSLAFWHWHIEVSSKCTLKCPRCSRSEVPDTLINTELSLDFFKKNFTIDFVKKHVEKITFCGDDGDPIYAHDFLGIVKYLKSIKPLSIIIITNGSYKTKEYWLNLAQVLDENDQVHFSIDGFDQQSNEQYRINSDWDSIMIGVNTICNFSKCYKVWDAIGFSFNQDKIDDMKHMAKQLGFDSFQLTKSTKFAKVYNSYGSVDVLQPVDNLISSSHRYERETTNLSGKEYKENYLETNIKYYNNVKNSSNDIIPLCSIGNKGLYINSRGEFYPCCWVANRYKHNDKWSELGKKFNLNNNLLTDIIADKFWSSDFTNEHYECNTKCNKNVFTKNYATSW